LQQATIRKLQSMSSQTFITTHSPLVAASSDPAALLVLRNVDGELQASRLRPSPLSADTPNGLRKLFQLNRVDTIAALMHEIVLIPEGFTDFQWFRLLMRAAEAHHDAWSQVHVPFGSLVGVVPTHDAAMLQTCEALVGLHPNVCCLVDGDVAGKIYSRQLQGSPHRPKSVLRWPDGWTVEDVIGWIVDAEPAPVLAVLKDSLAQSPADTGDLVEKLKSKERQHGGLKGDIVAYEAIVQSISEVNGCMVRLQILLEGLASACQGEETPLFSHEGEGRARSRENAMLTFNPS
jgi:putative ATP-dependent endonuclease of OLD family